MSQQRLGEFSADDPSGDADRPPDEAAAVAGAEGETSTVVTPERANVPDADGTIELAVMQLDYTLVGSGTSEEPIVHVFGRTADGRKEHVRVIGFDPYFYVRTDDVNEDELAAEDRITGWEHGFESIRGEELTKITGQTPRDVGQLRERWDEHFEADILFPNRLLIDKDLQGGMAIPERRRDDGVLVVPEDEIESVDPVDVDPRVHTMDIEVDDRQGFPEDGEEEILCLTSHDSYRDEYVVWLFVSPDLHETATVPSELPNYEPIESENLNVNVRTFTDEQAMLVDYLEYVEESDPDLLTGWNCLPAETNVQMADGTTEEIQDVSIGDEVVGSEGQSSAKATVTDKWESEKPVYEFELADGTSLRTSQEHRVMVRDVDGVDWKEGGDIESGDYVLKPRKLPVDTPTIPTLGQLLPDDIHPVDDELPQESNWECGDGAGSESPNDFNIGGGNFGHPTAAGITPDRGTAAGERTGEIKPDGGLELQGSGSEFTRKLTIRETYLAGLLLTDGLMSEPDGIRFHNSREERHDASPAESSLPAAGQGRSTLDGLDPVMRYCYNGLGIPFENENETAGDLSTVYALPTRYIERFLAGVMDGSATVSSNLTIPARNHSMATWYVKLLRRLGIYATVTGRTVHIHDGKRDVQRLKRRVKPHMRQSETVKALDQFAEENPNQRRPISSSDFDEPAERDDRRIATDDPRRGMNSNRHPAADEWESYVFVEVTGVSITGTETMYDIETTTHDFIADDCLVHNCDDFDIPYIIDRFDRLGIDYDRLSRVEEVWRSDWGGPDVKGRVVFDLLRGYRSTKFSELESYRLDAVGEQELGVGKERYPGDIGDLWEDDPTQLLEYNLRDVEICVEIDRKQEVIAFWQEVAYFVGCKIEDAPTAGDAVDMYVLHKAHGEFALPSKGQQPSGEEFEGGAVFEPISGVRNNVAVLDLACFTEDTEVMTPAGRRDVRNIDTGDAVYTLDPDTFECTTTTVTDTHVYENRYGEIHQLDGQSFDFEVTENHRFLVSNDTQSNGSHADFEFVEFRDLAATDRYSFPTHEPMEGRHPSAIRIGDDVVGDVVFLSQSETNRPMTGSLDGASEGSPTLEDGSSHSFNQDSATIVSQSRSTAAERQVSMIEPHRDVSVPKGNGAKLATELTFPASELLSLLGWYLATGTADKETERITLQLPPDGDRHDRVALVDRLDLAVEIRRDVVSITNDRVNEWLLEQCGRPDQSARIPSWLFELDGRLLDSFLDSLLDTGGTVSRRRIYRCENERLAEDIARLMIRCGDNPSIHQESNGTWSVGPTDAGTFRPADDATVLDHDGSVYCLTTAADHVILAGRNGQFQWVGQSLYPMSMVTINASPETKVSDDFDGETYHAPTGTKFRKEPDGIIREMVEELLAEREEKKELRNRHDPGESAYELYDRQQEAVKVIMNCFTPDTDVLTPNGVRSITELTVGDPVYSFDPETETMEPKPVVETQAYPDYRGPLLDIETDSVDFRITPNHRMLVRSTNTEPANGDGYQFLAAGNLSSTTRYELPTDWTGPDGDRLAEVDLTTLTDTEFEVWTPATAHDAAAVPSEQRKRRQASHDERAETIYPITASSMDSGAVYDGDPSTSTFVRLPTDDQWVPRTVDGTRFLELLGQFMAERRVAVTENGSAIDPDQTSLSSGHQPFTVDRLADGGATLGKSLPSGDSRAESASETVGGSHHWPGIIEAICTELTGGQGDVRRIPGIVFSASTDQKRCFLEALLGVEAAEWGSIEAIRIENRRLRDDVLRLCTHLGISGSYSEENGVWRVAISQDPSPSIRMAQHATWSTAENGVYCVTVKDNNTVMAGRNGTFQFVGQSLYGVSGWEQFRLYDKDAASAVTATGRAVIEFTADVVNERGKQVIYGDTDSVMLELGDDISTADGVDQALELADHINDRYDEFAKEQLNAAFHRFEIEFEKLYRRFFQAGKKKRYAGHIIWKEGNEVDDIDITGFEYKRSDIAQITKDVQHRVLEMIVEGKPKAEINAYLNDVIEEFLAGEYSYEDVGIPGGIGKRLDAYETDTAQVRGAKYANLLLGTNFARGSKPKRLYLEKVHPSFFEQVERERGLDARANPIYGEFKRDPDVICFEYDDQIPDAFTVDWEKMLEKTLRGPISRVIEALDMSWEEVRSGQEQTGLGQYM